MKISLRDKHKPKNLEQLKEGIRTYGGMEDIYAPGSDVDNNNEGDAGDMESVTEGNDAEEERYSNSENCSKFTAA